MDDHAGSFYARVIDAIESSDVFCIFFPRLGKTLVVDLRHATGQPPMIVLDDMAGDPTERLERLVDMRPAMPPPDELQIVPWLPSTSVLREAGVEEVLIARCADAGGDETVVLCRRCLAQLAQLERAFIRAIVRGDGARTIWQRE